MPALSPVVAIVENDAAVLTAYARVLRAGGFNPITYRSAEDFIASPPPRPPSCVVVDMRLDGMSGLDLQRRLASLGSSIPVIVMTGLEDSGQRDEARRIGCAAYLDKETDIEVLLDLIRSFQG
jgi:FixJ family two-component response regulator